MRNFIDLLIDACKKKVEMDTGETCDVTAAWNELHRIFKTAQITKSNKFKIFDGYQGNPKYRISRGHALALALALEFDVEEFNTFLAEAGYVLSKCHPYDIIILELISKGKPTVWEANAALYERNFAPLNSRN